MKQLTVRGFDDELSVAIQRLAKHEGISLNQAALRLLRRGAGLDNGVAGRAKVGPSLDHLIRVWTPEEADELDAALQEFEKIDEEMWK